MTRLHFVITIPADARARIPGVSVSYLADSGRVIHIAAARNPGSAAAITLFGLAFTGIAAGITQTSAPLLFPIAFGLAALLIDMAALNSWLSSSTITVRPRALIVDRGLPMLHHQRELPAGSISQIGEGISSSSNNTVYYRLFAVCDGNRITLASGIRGKQDAEYLVAEIKQGLGRRDEASSSST